MVYICFLSLLACQANLFVYLYCCGLHRFPFSFSRSSEPFCVPVLLWLTFVSFLSKQVKPKYLCSFTDVVYICFLSFLAGQLTYFSTYTGVLYICFLSLLAGQANRFVFLYFCGLLLFSFFFSRSSQPICVPALLCFSFVSFIS